MLLSPAEYIKKRLNKVRHNVSVLSYGSRHQPRLPELLLEMNNLQKQLNKELRTRRTIVHNLQKANAFIPNFSNKNWNAKLREANRLKRILPEAQRLREAALRRKAMNIIKKYWYKPPEPVGRGYLRLFSRRSSNWT